MFTVIANYLVFLQFSYRKVYKPEINPEFKDNLIEDFNILENKFCFNRIFNSIYEILFEHYFIVRDF